MNEQEWKDGKAMMDEARENALKLGKWTHKLKVEAVFGVRMITDAKCGNTDILQDFIMHRDGQLRESWKKHISNEFERHFTDYYKNLKDPQPPSEQTQDAACKTCPK